MAFALVCVLCWLFAGLLVARIVGINHLEESD